MLGESFRCRHSTVFWLYAKFCIQWNIPAETRGQEWFSVCHRFEYIIRAVPNDDEKEANCAELGRTRPSARGSWGVVELKMWLKIENQIIVKCSHITGTQEEVNDESKIQWKSTSQDGKLSTYHFRAINFIVFHQKRQEYSLSPCVFFVSQSKVLFRLVYHFFFFFR